jgi:hypothetical protein
MEGGLMLDLMSLEPAPRVTAMAYRIEYLHDGKVIGTEMAVGTLEAAQQIARMAWSSAAPASCVSSTSMPTRNLVGERARLVACSKQ